MNAILNTPKSALAYVPASVRIFFEHILTGKDSRCREPRRRTWGKASSRSPSSRALADLKQGRRRKISPQRNQAAYGR
jgi:hypothetical protein